MRHFTLFVATVLLVACAEEPQTIGGFQLGMSRSVALDSVRARGFEIECNPSWEALKQSDPSFVVPPHMTDEERCRIRREGERRELLFRGDSLFAVGTQDPTVDIGIRYDSLEAE